MNNLDTINKYILESVKSGEINRQRAVEALSLINSNKMSDRINWVVSEIEYDVFGSRNVHMIDEIQNRIGFKLFLDKLMDLSKSVNPGEEHNQIKRVGYQEYYPLSSHQRRIFAACALDKTGIAYNIPQIINLEADLNKQQIETMIRMLIKRHEILRTSFKYIDGIPVQIVHDDIDFSLEHTHINTSDLKEIVKAFVRPFDLDSVPLFRVGIVSMPENKTVLVIDIHHIISDGYSLSNVLTNELLSLSRGEVLPEPKLQYKDFSVWQQKMLENGAFEKMKRYWLEVFSGDLPLSNMPLDHTRPPVANFSGDYITFSVAKEIKGKLKNLSAQNGATLYMTLLAAYYVLLSKYTGQEDIVVGSMSMGRNHKGTENMLGVFVNILALRNYPKASNTFRELLLEVKSNMLKALENEGFQYDELVKELHIKRDKSRNLLFDTVFYMQSHIISENNLITRLEKKTSQFDITLEGLELDDEIKFALEYDVNIYKKETMERFCGHFVNILKQIMERDEITIQDIDILSEAERHQILFEFNHTEAEYPKNRTIHELFEEQAENTPDNIAVKSGREALTYKELNEKSEKLASVLADKGVKAESIVGIMVDRSLDMLVGILGVLKSGAAYLPIDPEYPRERIEYMLEDSGAKVVLTNKDLGNRLQINIEKLKIDEEWIYKTESKRDVPRSLSNNLAYIIYTSGSTGKPKGVMIEHRAVVNFIYGIMNEFQFKKEESILCLTTISFDIFVLETLLPLVAGMKIVLANERAQRDIADLANLINEEQIKVLQVTPSRMQMILGSEEGRRALGKLRIIMIGGERLNDAILKEVKNVSKARIYNMYGPTETTVWSSVKELTGVNQISIGKPIANTSMYVVDRNNKLQAIGILGELCIAGDGLGRGYLKRHKLTEEKFVKNPFIPGTRMYKTGDIAKWLPDGSIDVLERLDNQVKIRGHRIELEEIENRLLGHDEIKEAVVVAREGNHEGQYLCAYIVSEREITVQELREYLSRELIEHMIPSYFCQLDHLPLTANGKIDRNALPEPEGGMNLGTAYVPPSNKIEEVLVELWGNVLYTKRIGIDDDFFKLGGNSLALGQLQILINERYVNTIKTYDLFENRTIREQAKLIADKSMPAEKNNENLTERLELLKF